MSVARRAWPWVLLTLIVPVGVLSRLGSPSASLNVREKALSASVPEKPLEFTVPDAPAAEPAASEAAADLQVLAELEDEPRCPAPLQWLLNAQNADGSWGDGATTLDGVLIGKPGLTGLALLSFLGAGYSHLSKEQYDGLRVGDAVKNALLLLLHDQREDGMFRSSRGGLDHAVAALALTEAYGLTGSNLFKDQAQAAVRALVGLQLQDGSWGDGTTTAWAVDVLKSAELSGLEFPRSAYDGLRAYYDRRDAPDAREMIARIFMDKNKADPLHSIVASRLVRSPPDSARSLHDVYFQTRALFQYDGPAGRYFKAWAEPFKRTLREQEGLQGVRGSDQVIHTSLTALCWTIYYR